MKTISNIYEGLLKGQDATMQAGDDAIKFAEWFVNQWLEGFKIDAPAAMNAMISAIKMEGKNTVVIDAAIANKVYIKQFMPDRMYIVKQLPKNIRTIKFINAKWGVDVNSFIGDLSNINIEVYKDDEKTFADIHLSFKMATAGNDIKLGRIVCDKFQLTHMKMETLTFDNNSIMLDVVLDSCEKLQMIYGRFNDAMSAKLPKSYIVNQLCQTGILPWGIHLNIYG